MKLVIVIDVEGIDPTLTDPHDVAENIIETDYGTGRYWLNDHSIDGERPEVVFHAAEWEDQAATLFRNVQPEMFKVR